MARRNNLAGWLLVSPVVFGLLVFTLYPFLASLYLSFCEYDIFTSPRWVGLWNYETMLTRDPLFWKSLGNVLYYTALAVPLGIVFGVGLALLLNARIRGQSVYRTIFFLPAIVPVVATSVLWIWLLGTWTDFNGPLLYLNDQSQYTLAFGLQQFLGAYGGEWARLMAAATVFTVPIIILFFLAQRTFIQGISTTGMKG
ncbi:MAG: sugar ABC transporter permease [Planctomycetes bacterium]|nr:sugar ABC transporter permease [Planctomycetota bacterium]